MEKNWERFAKVFDHRQVIGDGPVYILLGQPGVSPTKIAFWLVRGRYVIDIETDMKLVQDSYCLKSYQPRGVWAPLIMGARIRLDTMCKSVSGLRRRLHNTSTWEVSHQCLFHVFFHMPCHNVLPTFPKTFSIAPQFCPQWFGHSSTSCV